jgi:hypothetical protein
MEIREKQRGPAKRSLGLAVWLLILAAFVAFAIYSGMNVDPSRY